MMPVNRATAHCSAPLPPHQSTSTTAEKEAISYPQFFYSIFFFDHDFLLNIFVFEKKNAHKRTTSNCEAILCQVVTLRVRRPLTTVAMTSEPDPFFKRVIFVSGRIGKRSGTMKSNVKEKKK
jgi:hypothetical protein